MKISTKLNLGFAFVILLLAMISIGSIIRLGDLSQQTKYIAANIWPEVLLAQRGLVGVNEVAMGARDMALASDEAGRQEGKQRLLDGRADIGKAWEALGPQLVQPDAKALFESILDSRKQYIVQQNRLIELVESGQHDAAVAQLKGDFRAVATEYRKRVNALIEYQGRVMT